MNVMRFNKTRPLRASSGRSLAFCKASYSNVIPIHSDGHVMSLRLQADIATFAMLSAKNVASNWTAGIGLPK